MTPSAFMQVAKVRGEATDIDRPSSLEGPDPKADQSTAGYGDSTQKCSTCLHFDGTSSCSKVDGEIDPQGHSKFWEQGETSSPAPDSEDESYDHYSGE